MQLYGLTTRASRIHHVSSTPPVSGAWFESTVGVITFPGPSAAAGAASVTGGCTLSEVTGVVGCDRCPFLV